MIKAIFFDLDGTLLPVNEDEFIKLYFGLLYKRLAPKGYEKEEFISCIWAGVKAMVKNDGSLSNEKVFWKEFAKTYGDKAVEDKEYINEFYTTEFAKVKSVCQENPYAREIIDTIKALGLKTILSTQPVFPRSGVITRLGFIGLKEEDFDYITSYENSHYAKPNAKYYEEILHAQNLTADEVIMFGNDYREDCKAAASVGIKCYIVGDYLKGEKDERFEHISLAEIKDKIIENCK